jgi:hypothetical protein
VLPNNLDVLPFDLDDGVDYPVKALFRWDGAVKRCGVAVQRCEAAVQRCVNALQKCDIAVKRCGKRFGRFQYIAKYVDLLFNTIKSVLLNSNFHKYELDIDAGRGYI